MSVYPITRPWIHEHLLGPYLQGSEMVTRAWTGVNFHSASSITLSPKERVFSWLIGTCLMLPLINSIIWICWQTLGTPERLIDPYTEN